MIPMSLHLDPEDLAGLADYLRAQGWLAQGEAPVSVQRAGEGNMNLALRLTTDRRSLIVKQGRPWVEKYPDIAAPEDRTLVEAEWYALAGEVDELAVRMPTVLGLDAANRVLCLQDLGDRPDMSTLYAGAHLSETQLDGLLRWLGRLHAAFAGDPRARTLENRAMRELNHEHIFRLPLEGDGPIDVDAVCPGLGERGRALRADPALVAAAAALGERYLGPGATLLHGDFFPGSWLHDDSAPWIIDPEFGFYGPPEFDIGVLLAHLNLADQDDALSAHVWEAYAAPDGFDRPLAQGFAGIEIIRRLLGVSQLPLRADLARREALLERGRALVLG